MALLQLLYIGIMRMMVPAEPKVIYRDVPVYVQQQHQPPVFTQPKQEVVLPEYEPRKPASDSLRMDAGLPDGIQETRPAGT